MSRRIVRSWHRHGVTVETRHPQLGPLVRGRIRATRDGWRWTDFDHNEGDVTGDYLDAERALLDATAALVELVPADQPAPTD